jgi:hypothetical protein
MHAKLIQHYAMMAYGSGCIDPHFRIAETAPFKQWLAAGIEATSAVVLWRNESSHDYLFVCEAGQVWESDSAHEEHLEDLVRSFVRNVSSIVIL